ncbi:hypothetical protein CK203_052989 [Vitis vinifera]|uniref:DUF4283 domain-containing protein n=1 Tax=Vitis vinifera TaxID=29760 RepID=A0A438GMH8_VITVI|nr:hypothetical protein CK203_052989 [Vitis vinifera]
MVTEIDWRTLKLFDLSRVRLRIAMKDRAILPALLEVTDGIGCLQLSSWWSEMKKVGEVVKKVSRLGRLSHLTRGQVEEDEGREADQRRGEDTVSGKDSKLRKGGERGKVVLLSMGTRGKGCQLPSLSCLNSNKTADRLDGIEEAVEDRAGGDEAIADVGC